MEKREFDIEIYAWSHDWFIALKGVESFDNYPYFGGDIDYGFGKSNSTKDGKIAYLFNNGLYDDKDIELSKGDERFQETVRFNVRVLNANNEWENKKSFEGTFTQALIYIQKEFNDG